MTGPSEESTSPLTFLRKQQLTAMQGLTPPPSPGSTHEEIALHVERILRSIMSSINTRSFNPDEFPWTSVAADYRIDCPHMTIHDVSVRTKSAWMQSLEDFCKDFPEVHSTVDCVTVSVAKNSGHAKCFMEFRVTGGPGFPKGMSKPSMGMYEFRYMEWKGMEGKWMFVKETTVNGSPICTPFMDGDIPIWGGG